MYNMIMRNLLICLFLFQTVFTDAQIIDTVLFEDFQSGVPANFVLRDMDGYTPNPPVSYITSAWVTRDNLHNPGVGDSVAVSTAFYTIGASVYANDWIITPPIVLTTNSFLSYKAAKSAVIDFSYYDVRIAQDTAIASFLANSPLDSTYSGGDINYLGETRTIDIESAGYSNDTFYIAFRNNTYTFVDQFSELYLDSIYIFELTGRDVAMNTLNIGKYVAVGGNNTLTGELYNNGADTIYSMNLNWNVNSGPVNTQNLSAIAIPPFTNYNYSHSINWVPPSVGYYQVNIWVDTINGDMDQYNANDTLVVNTFAVSPAPTKRVLVEEFASAAINGWVPDGDYKLQQILDSDPNVIGAAIHFNDSMEILDGANVILAYSNFSAGTFLSGSKCAALVDRYLFSDQSSVSLRIVPTDTFLWSDKVTEKLNEQPALDISLTNYFDTITRALSVDVTAKYEGPDTGDFRFNCYIVEDSVSKIGALYDQFNHLDSSAGHPYEFTGNPIVGYNHMHVVRYMFGGPWGTVSSGIPSIVPVGDSITYQYNYPGGGLPTQWKYEDITLVAFVQKYNLTDTSDREIVNAVSSKLNISTTGIDDMQKNRETFVSVYPNPFNRQTNIVLNIDKKVYVRGDIYNILGEKIVALLDGYMPAGTYKLQWDGTDNKDILLPGGIYIVIVTIGEQICSNKIIINR